MRERLEEIKGPVAWLPAGLISWYAPGGSPVVLVTSWLAMIGGKNPRVRTAWHGRHDPLSRFWPGGDFVLNVPSEDGLKKIQQAIKSGRVCLTADDGVCLRSASGLSAVAPLLLECVIQIECVGGVLIQSEVDVELCGDVVRIHRHQAVVDPSEIPDVCAINPLSPIG